MDKNLELTKEIEHVFKQYEELQQILKQNKEIMASVQKVIQPVYEQIKNLMPANGFSVPEIPKEMSIIDCVNNLPTLEPIPILKDKIILIIDLKQE